MRPFLSANSLSLFFFVLLTASLLGQSFAGQHDYNADQAQHGGATVSWPEYVTSPQFWGAVMENWQSEFLQFSLFIFATVWLVQRGSNESKPLENVGRESDQMQRIGGYASAESPRWAKAKGWRTALYENSLMLVMASIFFATWAAQSVAKLALLQRGAAGARRPDDRVGTLPRRPGLLGEDAPELAIRVSRRRGPGSSPSTSASVAHPSRNRSARRTTRPARRASYVSSRQGTQPARGRFSP